MCRTREEIIESRPDLQDLQLQIENLEEKIKHDENGKNLLQLRQARVNLNSAILQIQMEEDMHLRFDDATHKREHIKEVLSTKVDKLNTKLDLHIGRCEENPSLKKAFTDKPLKVISSILAISIPAMISIYLLLFSILHVTGWEAVIKAFLNNLLGL